MKKLTISLLFLAGLATTVASASAQPRHDRGCRVWRSRHHHRYCARWR